MGKCNWSHKTWFRARRVGLLTFYGSVIGQQSVWVNHTYSLQSYNNVYISPVSNCSTLSSVEPEWDKYIPFIVHSDPATVAKLILFTRHACCMPPDKHVEWFGSQKRGTQDSTVSCWKMKQDTHSCWRGGETLLASFCHLGFSDFWFHFFFTLSVLL